MTGWRVGYLNASKAIVDAIYLSYQHTLTCVSEFSQIAGIVALDCTADMERMRQSYERRRNLFVGQLQQIKGFTCLIPEGAFYAWCRIEKDGMSAPEVSNYLLEKANVVSVNGHAYGSGSEKCVRMCFASSEEELNQAVKNIKKAFL